MLRYDSWSSRRLLYGCTIKTWFKAILEIQNFSSWFCRLLFFFFFQKLPPEGQLNHETYVSKLIKNRTSPYHIIIWYLHMISPYDISIWYLRMISPYDISIWYLRMISPYDITIWYHHMISTYDTYQWHIPMIYMYAHMIHIWYTQMTHT